MLLLFKEWVNETNIRHILTFEYSRTATFWECNKGIIFSFVNYAIQQLWEIARLIKLRNWYSLNCQDVKLHQMNSFQFKYELHSSYLCVFSGNEFRHVTLAVVGWSGDQKKALWGLWTATSGLWRSNIRFVEQQHQVCGAVT